MRRPGQELAWSDGLVRRPDQRAFRWYATASRTASAVTSVTITRSRSRWASTVPVARRDGEVAVVTGVRRVDGARQARGCRTAGEQVALGLGAPGVGGDHRPAWCCCDRVPPSPTRSGGVRWRSERSNGASSGTRAIGRRRRGHDRRAVGGDDVADRVHRRPARPPRRRRPTPTRSRSRRWCRARARATSPRSRRGRRRPARCEGVRVGPSGRRPPARRGPRRGRGARRPRPEVEDRRRGDDRHRSPAGREAPPLLGQRTHHAVGGGETEGGAAGQHDRVDVLDRWRTGRAPRSHRVAGAPPRISMEATVSGGAPPR